MEFHHRKLTTDSDGCKSFCDSDVNESGSCPSSCLSVCSDVCVQSLTKPSEPHKLSLYLVLSLSLMAAALFLLSLYVFYIRCYSRRRRLRQGISQAQGDDLIDDDQEALAVDHPIWYIRTIGLEPSVISAIAVCKYKRGDGLVDGTECSICLSEFQEDETLRLLPKCNHAFHLPCIDTWLRSHTNCPMCRAGIVSSAAGAPSPDQMVQNSGPLEEIPENSAPVEEMEEEGAICESITGREEERGLELELESDEAEDDQILQPMRRSVSMDSLSASMITLDLANVHPGKGDGNSDSESSKSKKPNLPIVPKGNGGNQSLVKLMESSTMVRILQSGSSSMKRSFSCSGKLFLVRHNRRRSSLLP